jgi:hypothetical protein
MNRYLIILIGFFLPLFCKSQSVSIKGHLIDSIGHSSLRNSTILILESKNSFLYKFSHADTSGKFEINNVKSGNYVLLVSCPNYADFIDTLSIGESNIDLGNIFITQKEHLLKEVTVQAIKKHAVQLIGDTTVFEADSFKVIPNATVEELLKKLPGIQVDKYGRISTQGKTVQKVLVDGEEFFGTDPVLVTRNLTADMIDKVQLYDRASDKSKFTGIEDNDKTKTIDLNLKKDKRNLLFGKVDAGIGSDRFYRVNSMFNEFTDKKKFAVYGLIGKDGLLGLNTEEQDQTEINYDGRGIPTAMSTGIHFDDKWDNGTKYFNGDYKFSGLIVNGLGNNFIQNNLPAKIITTSNDINYNNKTNENRSNGKYNINFNNKSSLNISFDASVMDKVNNSNTAQNSLENNSNSNLLNTIHTNLVSYNNKKTLTESISWQKQFNKGTTYSITVRDNLIRSGFTSNLHARELFYLSNIDSSISIDQSKTGSEKSNELNVENVITVPLGNTKKSHLVIDHFASALTSESVKNSYNKLNFGKLDSSFSGNYKFNSSQQTVGFFYDYTVPKVSVYGGTTTGYIKYNQSNIFANPLKFKSVFTIFNPQLTFRYNFSSQHRITVSFNKKTVQPTIDQLQPIRNNEDPLNLNVGNPNLRPSLESSFNLIYLNFKISNRRTILINSTYSITKDPIVLATSTDTSGISLYKNININNRALNRLNSYIIYSRFLKSLNININSSMGYEFLNYLSFVNSEPNLTSSSNYNVSFRVSKTIKNILDLIVTNQIKYDRMKNSLQTFYNNAYWSYMISPSLEINLKRLIVNTDASYSFQQQTALFPKLNMIIWNAGFGINVLKKQNLFIKFRVNDILNQNIGRVRSVNSNRIIQESYSTIKRYAICSAIWNFKSSKKNDK